ncbi:hypothetical protein BGZ58_001183 [Dissophora ornata]|nr:hypothetical protein BGZ58_001183 [Dissophora ornata]
MVSERKKLFAILERRQRLEDEYQSTQNEAIKEEMNSLNPSLIHYFHCSTVESFYELYPTTLAMKAAAERRRYFASRRTPVHRTGHVYETLRRAGTDVNYLEFVRVSKSVFLSIVSSILSQHQIFKNHSNNGQESIEKQLAITLWRLGHHGHDSGISEASKIFGVSDGTIMKCTQRCVEALKDISSDVISWPSMGERRIIKTRISDIASASSPSGNSGREHTNNGIITDAIGILSTMSVFLVSRPLLKNPDEYLVPLHPTALAAAASLTSANLSTLTSTTSTDNKRARRSRGTRSARAKKTEENQTVENTAVEESLGESVRTRKRSRPRRATQGISASTRSAKKTVVPDMSVETTASLTPDTASATVPEKKLRPRPWTFVKLAYLKRHYGFNVLVVCDSTTRIRFTDVSRPASWPNQQVLSSSELSLEDKKYFEDNEYLIADSGFLPEAKVIPMFSESELQQGPAMQDEGPSTTTAAKGAAHRERDAVAEDDLDSKKQFNEPLSNVQKRAMDCQRTLKARFPSLLGMRVQLKDDTTSQENAMNWVLACMTIHNLVLGDETSYNPAWETQLEELEKQVLKQQEQQARLLWRNENPLPKKPRKTARSAPQQPDSDADIIPVEVATGGNEEMHNSAEEKGEEAEEAEEEEVYELVDTPTPEADAGIRAEITELVDTNEYPESSSSSVTNQNPAEFSLYQRKGSMEGEEECSTSEEMVHDGLDDSMQDTRPTRGHSLSLLLN